MRFVSCWFGYSRFGGCPFDGRDNARGGCCRFHFFHLRLYDFLQCTWHETGQDVAHEWLIANAMEMGNELVLVD